MNVYTAKFRGVYPVGAVALIITEDKHMALILLNEKFKSEGFESIDIEDIKQQDTSTRRVDILLNGDY